MSTTLSKGRGPLDHVLINKAAELPGLATGQFFSIAPVMLQSPGRPVPLQMRITAPTTGMDLPIILLSHGHGSSNNLSSLNGYAPTAQFYAAHGFVVFQPTHLAARALGLPSDTPGAPMFWHSRIKDMIDILDRLDEIESLVPFIQGRLDRDRVVIWGHSAGSHAAGALLGMRVTDNGREYDLKDSRIKLGVYVGGIGSGSSLVESIAKAMPYFATSNFSNMDTPTLIVAGDEDESPQLTTAGWRFHTEAYELSPGPKDLLVLHHGRHSFGGISGWDSSDCKKHEEESPEMCEATLRMTVAYIKSKLYDGDVSWAEAQKALMETKLGTVESK